MKKHLAFFIIFFFILISVVLMNSCQQEYSFETKQITATGSLQDDGTGNCFPETVSGAYIVGTNLIPLTNTIQVTINVTQTGSYSIYSDTINGYYFHAAGIFSTLGTNPVTLNGIGNPLTSGINNFLVVFDSTACSIPVNVLPAGSGPATLTLSGSPGNCTNAMVNGIYTAGTPLSISNTVTITVNVTAIGTYNITTSFQGMTFSGSGTFGSTGLQTVTLNGSGTPTNSGVNNIPITVGSSSCIFSVTVN